MGTEDQPQPAADGALATAMANLERTQRRFPEGQRRIFRAALDAFAERGFHATTTRDIAARAGLSPAGLYVHFGSKEEVLHQISVSSLLLTRNVVTAAATAAGTPVERLAATVRELSVWHAEHAATVRIVLHHLTDLTPEHRTEVTDIQRDIFEIMRTVVAEGAATGDFDITDPGATTIAITSLCVDTARWYLPGSRRTPAQIGDDNAAAALRVAGVRAR
ncbi:TetR/AcrR family transcriptional regulator [Nocardia inohanensis]|uniref:TetR/AcrR family transcriptional regulator n=1 Tax=Nocardia inohanensis TaxID=209246 RepID=UPI000ACE5A00|nr:TetR/AcrR family transcriptional regulator [Nocardia inohanensis]